MQQTALFKDEKKNNNIELGVGLTLECVGGQGKQAKKIIQSGKELT